MPYTLVTAVGTAPVRDGDAAGAVQRDDRELQRRRDRRLDPADFAAGQLTALDTYEATFGVRQVDGYTFPTSVLGLTDVLPGRSTAPPGR